MVCGTVIIKVHYHNGDVWVGFWGSGLGNGDVVIIMAHIKDAIV